MIPIKTEEMKNINNSQNSDGLEAKVLSTWVLSKHSNKVYSLDKDNIIEWVNNFLRVLLDE